MSYTKDQISNRKFDVVIVGAGGSGMRASLQLARAGLNVAVLSKVFPTRSHTVAARASCSEARMPEPPAPTMTTSNLRRAMELVVVMS